MAIEIYIDVVANWTSTCIFLDQDHPESAEEVIFYYDHQTLIVPRDYSPESHHISL